MTAEPTLARDLGLDLRLGRALEERARAEGGYSKLAHAITRCIPRGERVARRGNSPALAIDRRRLRALAKGELKTVLSIRELSYLNYYLEPFGDGLAHRPIFDRVDPLHALAETGRMTFLLGTKPDANDPEDEPKEREKERNERQNISHWDTVGMALIQNALNTVESHVRVTIQDVPLQKEERDARALLRTPDIKALFETSGPSLVVIGSSRINPVAEAALAIMLGHTPFKVASTEQTLLKRFAFIWNPARPYVHPSALHLSSKHIANAYPDAARAVDEDFASALAIGDDVYLDELSYQGEGTTYGICAVQRRSKGQVWMVISGLTGVATYVGAKTIGRLKHGLHEPHKGRNSPIYWGLIRAQVPKTDHLASLREFTDEQIIPQDPILPVD
jgi:hypothetical protein